MFEGLSQDASSEQLVSYSRALQLLVLTIVLLGSLLIAVFLPRLFRSHRERSVRRSSPTTSTDVWSEAARRMQADEDTGEAGDNAPPHDDTPPDQTRDGRDQSSGNQSDDPDDDDVDFREDLGGRL